MTLPNGQAADPGRMDELALARKAEAGDSDCALELSRRSLRCAVSVARKMRWYDALDPRELEEDVSGEVVLRLIGRIRNGFDGEPIQFRTYLYRVVTSVVADAVRRNVDRRHEVSLDAPFENADGQASSLRDFIETTAGIGGAEEARDDPVTASLEADRKRRLLDAVAGLDEWCRIVIREAVVEQRPHAEIAREQGVTVVSLDVSLKRCTERLYRNLLMACVSIAGKERRHRVSEVALRLPEDLRSVFVEWWDTNCSVKSIADRQGVGSDEVRRLLARAKCTMWHLMEEP